jgi:hypothetical protein
VSIPWQPYLAGVILGDGACTHRTLGFPHAIAYRGMQRIFNVPDELIRI